MSMQEPETKPAQRRPLFVRALLFATVIEIGMLLLSGAAMGRSFFSHSAADPHSAANNPLASIGLLFHLPSLAITAPLGLVILAPLVQILFLAGIIYIGRRWWKKMGH